MGKTMTVSEMVADAKNKLTEGGFDVEGSDEEQVVVTPDAPTDDKKNAKLAAAVESITVKLIEKRRELAEKISAEVDASSVLKERKKASEVCQAALNELVDQLCDARNGNFQPELSFGDDPELPHDEGGERSIDELAEYSLTAGKVEAIKTTFEVSKISQFERVLREDAYWHQKIKGFGETWIDRTIDSLRLFREDYPHPVPMDEEQEGDE